jgi:hypothetical protein
MHYTPETLSDEAIEMAGQIAPDYGLPVKVVADVIETLLVAPLPKHEELPQMTKLAEALRPITAKLVQPVCELQRFAFFGVDGIFPGESFITLPVLAAATGSYRFDALVRLREILQAAAHDAAAFDAEEIVLNPRRAMLVSKMALAAHVWWDMTDEYAAGEFVWTDEGLQATPDSGVEFVVRIVAAADPDVTVEEMADCLDDVRKSSGVTLALMEMEEEEAVEEVAGEARRAHLRVVK